MYILDEDAEDTEDADDDRPSFQSRTTMSVEFYHVYKRIGTTWQSKLFAWRIKLRWKLDFFFCLGVWVYFRIQTTYNRACHKTIKRLNLK